MYSRLIPVSLVLFLSLELFDAIDKLVLVDLVLPQVASKSRPRIVPLTLAMSKSFTQLVGPHLAAPLVRGQLHPQFLDAHLLLANHLLLFF